MLSHRGFFMFIFHLFKWLKHGNLVLLINNVKGIISSPQTREIK